MVVVEEITITRKNASAVGGLLFESVIRGSLHEAAKRLNARFVLGSLFLRKRWRRQRRSQHEAKQSTVYRHLNSPYFGILFLEFVFAFCGHSHVN